jgi:hypothetical protein
VRVKVPEPPLEAIQVLLRELLLPLALGRHGQRSVLELDRDRVLGDPGQVKCIDELVLGLPDVDGGHPAARGLAVAAREAGERQVAPK